MYQLPNVISSKTKGEIQRVFGKVQEGLPKLSEKVLNFFRNLSSVSHFDTRTKKVELASPITYRLVHLLHLLTGVVSSSFEEFVQDEVLHELYHTVLDFAKPDPGRFRFLLEDTAFQDEFAERFGEEYRGALDEILAKAITAVNSGADAEVFGTERLKGIYDVLGEMTYEGKTLSEWLILPNVRIERNLLSRAVVSKEERKSLEDRLKAHYEKKTGEQIQLAERDEQSDEALEILEALAESKGQLDTIFREGAQDLPQHIAEALAGLTLIQDEKVPSLRASETSA
jgi:hypothetical protein